MKKIILIILTALIALSACSKQKVLNDKSSYSKESSAIINSEASSLQAVSQNITSPQNSSIQSSKTSYSSVVPIKSGQFIVTANLMEYEKVLKAKPLKGLMPFMGNYSNNEYSMEWFYITLADVLKASDTYDWSKLESNLNTIKSRGNQAAFRFYLDYPGQYKNGEAVPQFIWNMGVKKYPYTTFGGGVNPDYKDQRLIEILKKFITELGKKYDGDPRIGFITCGLIGHWGEWHTYDDDSKMPTDDQRNQIFDAYDKAFNKTFVLARYPDAANVSGYSIGFHDDSFAYNTLTAQPWFFLSRMQSANAENKWKTLPIGGELRPECQTPIFEDKNYPEGYEDYTECIKQTHCSWLMAHQAFEKIAKGSEVYNRVIVSSEKLGYDYFISKVNITGDIKKLNIEIEIFNNGVAPFYYNWPVFIRVLNKNSAVVMSTQTNWAFSNILPNTNKKFSAIIDASNLEKNEYTVVVEVVNVLDGGKPFIFSNKLRINEKYAVIANIK